MQLRLPRRQISPWRRAPFWHTARHAAALTHTHLRGLLHTCPPLAAVPLTAAPSTVPSHTAPRAVALFSAIICTCTCKLTLESPSAHGIRTAIHLWRLGMLLSQLCMHITCHASISCHNHAAIAPHTAHRTPHDTTHNAHTQHTKEDQRSQNHITYHVIAAGPWDVIARRTLTIKSTSLLFIIEH